MTRPNVLILCTGNSCRSIMGEALLRARAGDRFNVYSAGTAPKGVNPIALQVLNEIGIDTRGLSSKQVSEVAGKVPLAYTITVCGNAEETCPRTLPGMGTRLFWPFDDPPAFPGTDEQKLNKYREVRDQIDAKIQAWLAGVPD
jgi:arsenate reductase (thioredoxin)